MSTNKTVFTHLKHVKATKKITSLDKINEETFSGKSVVKGIRDCLLEGSIVVSMAVPLAAAIGDGAVRISEHGYDELSADGISVRDVVSSAQTRHSNASFARRSPERYTSQ